MIEQGREIQLQLFSVPAPDDNDDFSADERYIFEAAAAAERRRERKMPFGPNLMARPTSGRDGGPVTKDNMGGKR